METIEYQYTDRSEWKNQDMVPKDEPDKKQWQDEATGLPCLVVRGPAGALCGYVGVTKEHPWFEVGYHDCVENCGKSRWPDEGEEECTHQLPENKVDVHGGLTFADKCAPTDKEHGVCHIVEAGEDDNVWWFGFDCAHGCDLIPKYDNFGGCEASYKTIGYVKSQVTKLAQQLHDVVAGVLRA